MSTYSHQLTNFLVQNAVSRKDAETAAMVVDRKRSQRVQISADEALIMQAFDAASGASASGKHHGGWIPIQSASEGAKGAKSGHKDWVDLGLPGQLHARGTQNAAKGDHKQWSDLQSFSSPVHRTGGSSSRADIQAAAVRVAQTKGR